MYNLFPTLYATLLRALDRQTTARVITDSLHYVTFRLTREGVAEVAGEVQRGQ